MGKGSNISKVNRARADAAKRAKDEGKGGGGAAGAAARQQKVANVCAVCKQTFVTTVKKPVLEEHAGRHAGKTFAECFPDYSE